MLFIIDSLFSLISSCIVLILVSGNESPESSSTASSSEYARNSSNGFPAAFFMSEKSLIPALQAQLIYLTALSCSGIANTPLSICATSSAMSFFALLTTIAMPCELSDSNTSALSIFPFSDLYFCGISTNESNAFTNFSLSSRRSPLLLSRTNSAAVCSIAKISLKQ